MLSGKATKNNFIVICLTRSVLEPTIYHTRCEHTNQGRIQDCKLGGTHLKKLGRAEGGAKIVGVFRVKNHDYTPKKSYFLQFTCVYCVYFCVNYDFVRVTLVRLVYCVYFCVNYDFVRVTLVRLVFVNI